jgi:8-oxo-dGTP pyrophosphatase MutT (NUDIX family)
MALPFDPRSIPILPAHEHLPPVSGAQLHPQSLRQRFLAPPVWAPDVHTDRWIQAEQTVPAAVLIPLVWRPDGAEQGLLPRVLLTQRTEHLKKHAGQISFPGGRAEPDDASLVATALREAHEEVGLAPERVEVLGSLPTYITGTGFEVTPVVGLIEALPHERDSLHLTPDAGEVASVFEVPLSFLMNPAHHQRHAVDHQGRALSYFSMPWRPQPDQPEYFIWGATAAMLRNFYRFLAA